MTPEDERLRLVERERGAEAQKIIDSSVWHESYELLANDLNARMLSAACSDEDTLQCKKDLLALHRVKKHIENVLVTGELANKQLEDDRDGR